jgi:flavin reductase (DIM6/NTAB) family NADH-FMN oxidoreductase RutF
VTAVAGEVDYDYDYDHDHDYDYDYDYEHEHEHDCEHEEAMGGEMPGEAALGRVTSGLFILTAGTGHQAQGMLTSWVMQAGFSPPMVTVALRTGRQLEEWLSAGHGFVLNIVASGDTSLIRHFGKGFDRDAQGVFDGLETTVSTGGIPILAEALGHLECKPVEHLDSGDHRIFLARVVGGRLVDDRAPMVHIRRTGARY